MSKISFGNSRFYLECRIFVVSLLVNAALPRFESPTFRGALEGIAVSFRADGVTLATLRFDAETRESSLRAAACACFPSWTMCRRDR